MVTKTKLAVIGGIGVVVIVAVTVGVVLGTQGSSCDTYDAPTGLKLTMNSEGVAASWGSPDVGDCEVEYKITYTIDGGEPVVKQSTGTTYVIAEGLLLEPCSQMEVEVVAISESDEESVPTTSTYTKNVEIDFVAVESAEVIYEEGKGVTLSWQTLAEYDRCDIEYTIIFGETIRVTNASESNFDITPEVCETYDISIEPTIDFIVGKEYVGQYNRVLDEGFVAIESHEVSTSGDQATFKWVEDSKYDLCSITYNVLFNDVPQEANNLEVTVDVSELKYCSENTFSVEPVIDGIVGEKLDATYKKPVEGDSEVIERIEEPTTSGDQAIFRWVEAAGYELCTITYNVLFNGDAHDAENLQVTIDVSALNYCDDNNFSVEPEIDGIVGEKLDATYRKPIEADFKAIERIEEPTTSGDQATFKWVEDSKYELCAITYNVLFNADAHDAENLQVTIDVSALNYCDDNNFSVEPEIDGIVGEKLDATYRKPVEGDFKAIERIEEPTTSGDQAIFRWVEAAGYELCTITYNVLFNGDAHDAENLQVTIDVSALNYCDDNNFSVEPEIDGIVGEKLDATYRKPIEADFKAIERIEEPTTSGDQTTFKWVEDSKYDLCSITYNVLFNDVPQEANNLEVTVDVSELKYCSENTFSVEPEIDGIVGEKLDATYKKSVEGDFKAIERIEEPTTSGDQAIFRWVEAAGYELCTITYNVLFNGDAHDAENLQVTIDVSALKYCDDNNFSVEPEIDGIVGEKLDATYKKPVADSFGEVHDVTVDFIDLETATINWEAPAGYESCSINYRVSFGDVTEETDGLTSTFTGLTLEMCQLYVVSITPVIDDKEGVEFEGSYQLDLPETLPKVDGLTHTASGSYVTISWAKPAGYDKCDFGYKYTYTPDVGSEQSAVTSTTSFLVPLSAFCTKLIYTVEIVDEMLSSQVEQGYYEGVFNPPTELVHDVDGKKLTWTVADNQAICDVKYHVTYTYQGQPPVAVQNVEENSIDLLQDLAACQTLDIAVRAESSVLGLSSDSVTELFSGDYPTNIQETVENLKFDDAGDKLKITWDPPTEVRFCTLTYSFTTTSLEPPIAEELDTPQWESTDPPENYCGESITVIAKYNGEVSSPPATEEYSCESN